MNRLFLPAALALIFALPSAGGSPPRVAAGQLYIYKGTETIGVGAAASAAKPDQIEVTALVTSADSGGSTVRVLETDTPFGATAPQGPADVQTVRFRPNGMALPETAAETLGRPRVPIAPAPALEVGSHWTATVPLPVGPPAPQQMTFVSSAGPGALVHSEGAATGLPRVISSSGENVTLDEFSQALDADLATGVIRRDMVHLVLVFSNTSAQFDMNIALDSVKQLSPAETMALADQMEQVGQVSQAVDKAAQSQGAAADLKAASDAIARFRSRYPSSRFQGALAGAENNVRSIQKMAEREAQHQKLVADMTGKPAPAFKLTSLAGAERSVNDYRGRVLLINFFASW